VVQFGKLEVVNEAPQTRYVAVGDADVAYQVFGDGPSTWSTSQTSSVVIADPSPVEVLRSSWVACSPGPGHRLRLAVPT
jgi:hypothetical protein